MNIGRAIVRLALLALALGASAPAGAVDGAVATAPLPPPVTAGPPATPVLVPLTPKKPKETAPTRAKPSAPSASSVAKKPAAAAGRVQHADTAKPVSERKVSRPARRESRQQVGRLYPRPRAPMRPRYYPGGFAPDAEMGRPPYGPPPWYGRGPMSDYGYPGPRGPW